MKFDLCVQLEGGQFSDVLLFSVGVYICRIEKDGCHFYCSHEVKKKGSIVWSGQRQHCCSGRLPPSENSSSAVYTY